MGAIHFQRFSARTCSALAVLLLCHSTQSFAFDQRLVGTWKTAIPTPDGPYDIQWIIAENGTYEVRLSGPTPVPSESGTLTADAGQWSKQSAQGTDGGSYMFHGTDRLIVSGAKGTLDWLRSAPAISANAPVPAEAHALFDRGSQLYRAGDMASAFPRFLQAAQLGHAASQLQVGWHYEKGAGIQQNYTQAAQWYERSAIAGDSTAMKNIGQMYEQGMGVREDWPKAARWYQKSAENGCVDGETALARAYRFGIGLPQNRGEALRWYGIAAEHGDRESAYDARWLRDPTNNVGFRNEQEHALVINNKLRFSGHLIGADPTGIRFRNSDDRTRWLAGMRNEVDKDEAETLQRMAAHSAEVDRLMGQGYTKEEAESKAPW